MQIAVPERRNLEVGRAPPLLNLAGLDRAVAEMIRKRDQDAVNACRRDGEYRLESESVRRDPDFASDGPVLADQISFGHRKHATNGVVRHLEHAGQRHAIDVKMSWQDALDADRQAIAETSELGDGTSPRQA